LKTVARGIKKSVEKRDKWIRGGLDQKGVKG